MARSAVAGGSCWRVVLPDHVYCRPCLNKVKLANVKTQIYHPSLPTLRAMERDNMMHKLADEHCRTTTCCTAENFANASMNQLRPSVVLVHGFDITETGRQIGCLYSTLGDIQNHQALRPQNCPVSAVGPQQSGVAKSLSGQGDLHFDGVAIRYFNSNIRNRRL